MMAFCQLNVAENDNDFNNKRRSGNCVEFQLVGKGRTENKNINIKIK